MKKEKTHRGFLWNTSVYLISTVFSVAVSIIVLPIFTRFLTPADYGIVVLFIMFGTLVTGVISVNINFASYMYYFQYKKDTDRFRTIYSTNVLFVLFVFMLFGMLIWFFSSWISLFLFKGRLTEDLVRLSFLSGCFEYLFLYLTTMLTAQVRSMEYAAITVSRIIINTGLSFYFIFFGSLTFLALIYALLLSQALIVISLLIMTHELLRFRFSFNDLKMSIKLSYPLLPNSMVGLVYSSFDKTMLNKLKNTDSVGYFAFGEKFSIILKSIQDAVSKSWDPYFMNMAHENSVAAREAIIKRFYEIAFLFMVIGLSIIYFSEEMIRLLTTKAFYPSMYVVPLYVYYYLFAIIATLAMNQVQFSKKMAYLLPVTTFGVVINIILNLILIPRFGAVGAAGAIATSALSNNLMLLYFGMKLYPLPLGKLRLGLLYLILIIFTVPVYPIMLLNIDFVIKISIKTILLSSFILAGVNLHYISRSSIKHVFGKIKGAAFNWIGA